MLLGAGRPLIAAVNETSNIATTWLIIFMFATFCFHVPSGASEEPAVLYPKDVSVYVVQNTLRVTYGHTVVRAPHPV